MKTFYLKQRIMKLQILTFLSLTCIVMANHKGHEEPPYKVVPHTEAIEVKEYDR